MVAFCLFILYLLLLVFLFRVSLFLCFSFLCTFLATTSSASYLLVRFDVLAFPAFFSERVPGLIWIDCVYLVTTAGVVARIS